MKIYCNGSATISHGVTGRQFTISSDELEWEQVGGSERGMGAELIYSATVSHEELGELSWNLSEYPVGAENSSETDVGKHKLVQDFDYGLEHEPDDWDDQDAASNNTTTSDQMVQWFYRFHEDPQNETPYDSEEEEYVFVYGGPYDASDVLQDEFGNKVDFAEIEKAVEEIEKDGTFEWAPSGFHSNQISTAREHEERMQEQESFERRKGSGFNVSREANELVLNSRSFALGLAHLFKNTTGEFSFALFGRWGSGKTTIANLVSELLEDPAKYKKELQRVYGPDAKDKQALKYAIVNFNAWKYRRKPAIWVYLYESFLMAFLGVGLVTRILRTIRVGIHKHGVLPAVVSLLFLALAAFPLVWVSNIIPYAYYIFGFSGSIGLVLLAYRWNASLRQLYDRYGVVSSHSEQLGLQAVIGEDLKALITSQTKVQQFMLWEQIALIGTTVAGLLVWLYLIYQTTGTGVPECPQVIALVIWLVIGGLFCASTICGADRVDRILLVIDDLDRCPQEELLELIDGIKLMIDDEQIGKFVQPLVLADSSILRSAIGKRLEQSLCSMGKDETHEIEGTEHIEEDNDLKIRIVEHIEKVFLCHIHIPETTDKDVNELVLIYAKEFGAEQEKDYTGAPIERAPLRTQRAAPTEKKKPDTSELVLSFAEVGSIQGALSYYCSNYSTTMTPRMVRTFLFKYQIVRMILHISGVDYDHEQLAKELATAVANVNGFCIKLDAKPNSKLTGYIRLVV